MDILDSHQHYNRFLVEGNRISSSTENFKQYKLIKSYTRQLKEQTAESVRQLIVKQINSNPRRRAIGISSIDTMIETLNSVKKAQLYQFKEYYKKDLFKAFRYLHNLTFGHKIGVTK
jgi:uncharacterized protein (DUF4213/DUF364 family)